MKCELSLLLYCNGGGGNAIFVAEAMLTNCVGCGSVDSAILMLTSPIKDHPFFPWGRPCKCSDTWYEYNVI